MTAVRPYRAIYVGELLQESALNVGGSAALGITDSPLARDGAGQLCIPGTSLAGALVATARTLFGNGLPPDLTGSAGDPKESLWRVYTARPIRTSVTTELRQGVGIRQDTGAAADAKLFDLETTPRGTKWWFCLEVDLSREGSALADAIACESLAEWRAARGWIGSSPARGLGWVRLQDVRVHRLSAANVDEWPNSKQSPRTTLEEWRGRSESLDDALKRGRPEWHEHRSFQQAWNPGSYIEMEVSIHVGERAPEDGKTESYGLDGLSIGGHTEGELIVGWDKDHFRGPEGVSQNALEHDFKVDESVAMMHTASGELEPFIPGSSLRGPLRHAMSRHLRAMTGATVRDPNVQHSIAGTDCSVDVLFGLVAQHPRDQAESGALLICDAYLASDGWQAAWLHHHAEDEFAGGVHGGSKFDRLIVTEGTFRTRLVIQAPDVDAARRHHEALKPALALARLGRVPLGGKKWRGAGWIRWEIGEPRFLRAGMDATPSQATGVSDVES